MLNLNLPLRILQAILAIIALGLNSYVTSWYKSHTPSAPRSPSFLIFVAVFTLISMPYLALNPALSYTHNKGRPNGRFFNKFAVLLLDLMGIVLWFAGWVALARFRQSLIVCGGHVCDYVAGSSGVGVVAWITYLITTVLATLHVIRTWGGSETVEPPRSVGLISAEPPRL